MEGSVSAVSLSNACFPCFLCEAIFPSIREAIPPQNYAFLPQSVQYLPKKPFFRPIICSFQKKVITLHPQRRNTNLITNKHETHYNLLWPYRPHTYSIPLVPIFGPIDLTTHWAHSIYPAYSTISPISPLSRQSIIIQT